MREAPYYMDYEISNGSNKNGAPFKYALNIACAYGCSSIKPSVSSGFSAWKLYASMIAMIKKLSSFGIASLSIVRIRSYPSMKSALCGGYSPMIAWAMS